jgi:hypothetical protein
VTKYTRTVSESLATEVFPVALLDLIAALTKYGPRGMKYTEVPSVAGPGASVADQAMYRAKGGRRNAVYIATELAEPERQGRHRN